MNGFNENSSRLANRAQASLLVMARVVSTAVMATLIFVAGIFIGRATVPALFEKDRTEQLLARIAQEVHQRKQILDQLRMKTPAPQVQYPDDFRKEKAQEFVPEVKTPPMPVASSAPAGASTSDTAGPSVKPAVPVQQPAAVEKPAAVVASSGPGGNRSAVSAPATEAVPVEKTPVRSAQTPVLAPSSMPSKTEKPQESVKHQAPIQAAASKPPEPAAPVSVGPSAKPATSGSLKAMVYSRKTADDLAASLRKRGLTPQVQPRMTRSGVRYEVLVSGIGSTTEAKALAETIRQTHSEAEISAGP